MDSGYTSKLQPTGIPDELDMGYKKKETQDDYKGLGRNNQDRTVSEQVFCFLLLFFSERVVNIRTCDT